MDLDYAGPLTPHPVSKLRRMTKRCMGFAGVVTGVNVVATLVVTLMDFFRYSMSHDFSELLPGMACISTPLAVTVILLAFPNAVARGSRAASITVGIASALLAVFSVIGTLLWMGIAGSEGRLYRLFSDPVSLLFLLMTLLGMAACVAVVVLLILCFREESDSNPYPRWMRRM